jgi:hypothetical protein
MCVLYLLISISSPDMPRRRVYNPGNRILNSYFRPSILANIPIALIPANTILIIPAQLTSAPCAAACNDFTSAYESYILQIIQYIIDRVNLDTVLAELQALQTEITTKVQAEAVIERIQTIILSVVDNITNRVNLDVVLRRLAYLQEELATATDLPVIYNDITGLLVYVIDQIINKENLDTVLANLTAIQVNMTGNIYIADSILTIHSTIISIVENITNRVNLDVVLRRLAYLQGLVAEALGKGC